MDATAIRFLGATRSRSRHEVRVRHQVGPIRLTDVMEITEWEHGESASGSGTAASSAGRAVSHSPMSAGRPRGSSGRNSSAFRGGWGRRWGRGWPSPCSRRCGRETSAVWAADRRGRRRPRDERKRGSVREDRRHRFRWAHRLRRWFPTSAPRGTRSSPSSAGTAKADEILWDPEKGTIDIDKLHGIDGAVHLAGAGVGDRRWSAAYKQVDPLQPGRRDDDAGRGAGEAAESTLGHGECVGRGLLRVTGRRGPDRGRGQREPDSWPTSARSGSRQRRRRRRPAYGS